MALPRLNYSTPEEFVNYYFEKLKEDLAVYNIQVTKVGFIGFLLNLLGYTYFDLKTYYDNLFKEAFIATAQSEESQYMQASIYGYLPLFSTAPSVVGTIEFDFNNYISRKPPTVVKREVYLGYDTSKNKTRSTFVFDGHTFTMNATYKFVEDMGKYYVEVTSEDGSKVVIPSSSATVVAPIYSTRQEIIKEVYFSIGKYNFGSHKTYYFSIEDGYFLSDLEVYITKATETEEEEYDVEYVKYLVQGDAKVVFLRKLTSTNFMIEFGSGIRGQWVSEGTCHLVIKYTEGQRGNLINSVTSLKIPIDGDILAYDYTVDSGVYIPSTSVPAIIQVPVVNFEYSNGGLDPLSGDDLRIAIVNYIQTRDNLVSARDFYNVASKYNFLSDFKFLFRKINVFDNIFYLCRAFRTREQEICYSTNHTQAVMNLTAPSVVSAGSVNIPGGTLIPGTYGYVIVACDAWGRTIPSTEVSAVVTVTENAVQISWGAVDYATYYIVYGRDPSSQTMYWIVDAPTTEYFDDGTNGTSGNVPTSYALSELVFSPTFTINSKTFISPFLYKGNTRMNYYEGYLIHELLRINFAEVIPEENVIGSSFEIPTLYMNLVYDVDNRTTTIQVKSYQDISPDTTLIPSGHTFSVQLTVIGVDGIYMQDMTWIEGTTLAWTYEYDNADTFGIFEDDVQFEVICYETTDDSPPEIIKRFTCKTDKVTQLIDISDILKLLRYSSGGQDYLLNVPVIYQDTYNDDPDYYLNKLYTFINGTSFSENRMITDEVQCRFLNTYLIESPYIEAVFVQGKNIFSAYNWLDDVLEIRDDAPAVYAVGDRYLVSSSASGTFAGHDNEIAEVVTGPTWNFITPEINDGVYDIDSRRSYIWNGTSWNIIPSIQLPLQMTVTIRVNRSYVEANSIDLGTEKEDLLVALADYLQKNKSGVNVKFYNSQIVDFVHSGRDWVKSVTVNVTDSSSSANELNNGLEFNDDDTILENLSNKLDLVRYVTPYLYWDVNNLVIKLLT